jgi:hypothetical protein
MGQNFLATSRGSGSLRLNGLASLLNANIPTEQRLGSQPSATPCAALQPIHSEKPNITILPDKEFQV